MVAADTGPLHLAAALGTPVVALFGPKDPIVYGPYCGAKAVIEAMKARGAEVPIPGFVNVFPYGSCTWWANQRYYQLHGVFVPWRIQSNAWQWTARAYQFGWHVASSPVEGAIIDLQPGVQGASSWAGHVAIVERILSNGHVIASNMNWGARPWRVTYIEFAPGSGVTFLYL